MLRRVILMARTVRGQITLIILAALLVVISTGDALESWVKRDYNVTQIESTAVRLGAIAELLRPSNTQERAVILANAREAGWDIALAPKEVVNRFRHSSSTQSRLSALADRLFPPEGDPPLGGWRTFMDNQRVVAQKVDEENVVIASGFPDSLLTSAFLGRGSNYVLAVLVLIVFFFAFAISTITEPIRRIAEAATHADAAGDTPIFVERGTAEIVALARALNGMRLRIRSMVDARTRMLRGISHDLRTPLTRLKLRVERLGERPETVALLEDIQQIEALLTESLNYLRNDYADEEPELVDVASIVQTACSNFSDVGHSISYYGPNKLLARCRPLSITRAVANLCDNATKFGSIVQVRVAEGPRDVFIQVEDDGPGVPLELIPCVVEPFFKGDASRSASKGGFGLGLSIVTDIARSHNGSLSLSQRSPHGLIAVFAISKLQT